MMLWYSIKIDKYF